MSTVNRGVRLIGVSVKRGSTVLQVNTKETNDLERTWQTMKTKSTKSNKKTNAKQKRRSHCRDRDEIREVSCSQAERGNKLKKQDGKRRYAHVESYSNSNSAYALMR